jgi:hypothetical protein
LEAGPYLRRYDWLVEQIPGATAEELAVLMAEKNQLYHSLQAKFPEELRILGYRNRRRAQRSRSP